MATVPSDIPVAYQFGLSVAKPGPKGSAMRVEEGVCVERAPMPKASRSLDSFKEMMTTRKMGETVRGPSGRVDDASLPKHVLTAGQMLTFEAFFKEHVVESGLENYRVRRVLFRYFVEDDSCQVVELKMENSGMDQGPFIKRHQLPSADGGTIHWTDIQVGGDVYLYGRVFRIVAADEFTHKFCAERGRPLAADISAPADGYTTLRDTIKARETGSDQSGYYGKKANPMKRFMEATLGNASAVQIRGIADGKKKFLEHDRKVLRFYGFWDDRRAVFGDTLHMMVHYFLADDTVEMLESHRNNSGRDRFPAILSRQRLPKNIMYNDDRSRGIEDDNGDDDYFCENDFCVGDTVNILGRDIVLYNADKFTMNWVKENRGIDMAPMVIDVSDPPPPVPTIVAPPATGYGTEEDSLGSVFSLIPKVPKKDYAKMRKYDGIIIRFGAVIKDAGPIDATRKFITAFYPEDDTMQVYEPPQRNTGVIGGKFMAREKLRNPDTGDFFGLDDFRTGAEIPVRGQRFVLGEPDKRTEAFYADLRK